MKDYNIVTRDRNFIDTLRGIPHGSYAAYLVNYNLTAPPGVDRNQVALRLATATTREVISELRLAETREFTHDKSRAKRFSHHNAQVVYEFMVRFMNSAPVDLAIEEAD